MAIALRPCAVQESILAFYAAPLPCVGIDPFGEEVKDQRGDVRPLRLGQLRELRLELGGNVALEEAGPVAWVFTLEVPQCREDCLAGLGLCACLTACFSSYRLCLLLGHRNTYR